MAMKLGTQTGSLVNHVLSGSKQPVPEVGMGATVFGWTDRHPATVIEVGMQGKYPMLKIQSDKYKRVDQNGMSEMQTYEYTPNPEGSITMWVFKDGSWKRGYVNPETERLSVEKKGEGLGLGFREKYYDFSF
jgi:hypothetical protein